MSAEDLSPDPLPPADLPELLWTIRYEYGTPFSYGPIGQEIVWLFASREHAQETIPEAKEVEPECGELHISEITLEELQDRFGVALFVDEAGTPWPVVLVAANPSAALAEVPLPDEPYALFTDGGGIDRYYEEAREGDWVVHRDDDTETDYVLFFEDMDTAQQVQQEFEEATGEKAEVRRTWAQTLTEAQSVRYYHASGQVEDISRSEYLRRCR